ncbi:hypothetical protein UK12_17300 [Saccharothrix sp. ST-888]|nr:hypothetical protein UK12_17300 [Saccharothrix sp. ST-888]
MAIGTLCPARARSGPDRRSARSRAAQDRIGIYYSQPAAYSFYAPWRPGSLPVFGDLTGDGKPDAVLPDANGNLRAGHTGSRQVASTASTAATTLRLWGSESRRCTSSAVSVLVDDATEDAGTQEFPVFEDVHGGGLAVGVRRQLMAGPVWPVPVVVPLVGGQDLPCMGFVHSLVGWAVTPVMCRRRVRCSRNASAYSRLPSAVSTRRKSAAMMPLA